MTLLDGHQRAPRDSATTLVWSLTLPRRAAAVRSHAGVLNDPGPATWTCARCRGVTGGIGAAAHHIELHRLQESLLADERAGGRSRARGRRNSASSMEHKRGVRSSKGSTP